MLGLMSYLVFFLCVVLEWVMAFFIRLTIP